MAGNQNAIPRLWLRFDGEVWQETVREAEGCMAENSDAAASQDALADAHAALQADRTLQWTFEPVAARPPPPDLSGPIVDFLRMIAPLLTWAFWIAVAIVVAAIAWMVLREIVRRRAVIAASNAGDAPVAAPLFQFEPARARALIEEADRLAAEGRFGEAVRILLHRSIDDIARAHPRLIGPASTSREISATAPLSDNGRAAFARIAAAVEASLFAGREIDAQGFSECRALYEGFALKGLGR